MFYNHDNFYYNNIKNIIACLPDEIIIFILKCNYFYLGFIIVFMYAWKIPEILSVLKHLKNVEN